ncbi:MAG: hypothetical protein DVB25_07515 [Verrucomicrobia bacterium]|nr:MAG: hypothetical protein DVB25_07515 [Verrucomicrobiota bacterium]
MSLSGSKSLLTDATRHLLVRWADTRNAWRDHKASEFEDLYLTDLATAVNTALRAIDELDHLLQKIHADCE